jgi:hypothetical protein
MRDRQEEAEKTCFAMECQLTGWLLHGYAVAFELLPTIVSASGDFYPIFANIVGAIAEAVEVGLDTCPKAIAMRLVDDPEVKNAGGADYLRNIALGSPALTETARDRAKVEGVVNSHRDTIRSVRFARSAQDLIEGLATGTANIPSLVGELQRWCEPSRASTIAKVLASSDFIRGFSPPDYLLDGILQRGFFYSLTGATGAGKTALSLRLIAHVQAGKALGGRDVAQARVLMLVGENADDVRMRWIALAENMGFSPAEADVHFVPNVFSIREVLPDLKIQAERIGGFGLVVVDTSAAYFQGVDENSNKQVGDHARDIRALTGLCGNPCVVVNCHPTKNAPEDNLLPRGGGAFLAEVDGNLICRRKDGAVEMGWQGKFRGPEFDPIAFELQTMVSDNLRDSRRRRVPTVIARPLSDDEIERRANTAADDLDQLMQVMRDNPGASVAALATACGWLSSVGNKPLKSKVSRLLGDLKAAGFAIKELNSWALTPKGIKNVKERSE